jgi:hypothetical protein
MAGKGLVRAGRQEHATHEPLISRTMLASRYPTSVTGSMQRVTRAGKRSRFSPMNIGLTTRASSSIASSTAILACKLVARRESVSIRKTVFLPDWYLNNFSPMAEWRARLDFFDKGTAAGLHESRGEISLVTPASTLAHASGRPTPSRRGAHEDLPDRDRTAPARGVRRASDAEIPSASRPRLGGISFLHRFGSALNRHVHLHACVTDGVFVPPAEQAVSDAPPAFIPARPITQADLAALTERVRRRVIRWFRLARLLDAAAAAEMLAWEKLRTCH